MRWHCLFALALMAAGAPASEWRTESVLPPGGLPVTAAGFSFHTPGKDWLMLSDLPPQNGEVWGQPNMNFFYGPPQSDPSQSSAEVMVWAPEWSDDPLFDPAVFDAEMKRGLADAQADDEKRGSKALRYDFVSETINGAHCAGSNITRSSRDDFSGARTEESRYRICAHPQLPQFQIAFNAQVQYKAGTEPAEAALEAFRAVQSLRFTSLPFRVRTLRLAGFPLRLAEADGSIWVLQRIENKNPPARRALVRIDPATQAVIATIPIGYLDGELVGLEKGLWIAAGRKLTRIDTQANRIGKTILLPKVAIRIIPGGTYLWALCLDSIMRIDPASGNIKIKKIDNIAGAAPDDILFANGSLFVRLVGSEHELTRFDAESLSATGTLKVVQSPLQSDGRYLWALVDIEHFTPRSAETNYQVVARPFVVEIKRFDPEAPGAEPVTFGRYSTHSLFGVYGFSMWAGKLCMQTSDAVTCIKPDAPDKEPEIVPIPHGFPATQIVAFGSLWLATSGFPGDLLRLDPK